MSSCKEKLNYEFHNTNISMQQSINFEEDYPIALILFNWIKTNYINEFDPVEIIEETLTNVFNNPAFLKSSIVIPNLAIDYFEYLNYFLKKGIEKQTPINFGLAEAIDANHTLFPTNCKQFSIEFMNRLFELMGYLESESKANFEKYFFYIIKNYSSYQPEILDLAISGLLNEIDHKIVIFANDSNEITSLKTIISDTKISQITRFKIFVYRSLACNTWWPDDDLRKISLITEYHNLLSPSIKKKFLVGIERNLNGILSPKDWIKNESWEKFVSRICSSFFYISKVHQINYNKLFLSINNALEYYINKVGYVETIIWLLKVLNADFMPKDINLKKTKLVKSMRIAMKKYKKIKKGLGREINDKFELKIGRNLFK